MRSRVMRGSGLDRRGRRGFGHSQDQREIVLDEANLIRDAATRLIQGESLTSIVEEWNRRGIRTTTGGPWRINALSGLLVQPRLAGLRCSKSTRREQPPPAILDLEIYERLVALRRDRKRGERPMAPRAARRYLLSGLLRCWRCGSRLTGRSRTGTSARDYYRCPSRGAGGCSGVSIRADLADEAAAEAALGRVADPDFAASVDSRAKRLARDRQALTDLVMNSLIDGGAGEGEGSLWRDGRLSGQAWRELKEKLQVRAEAADSQLVRQEVLARQQNLCASAIVLRTSWDEMDIHEQRGVIGAVVDHFVVIPAAVARDETASRRLRPVWRD